VWSNACVLKLPRWLNLLPQTSQTCDFCPVWTKVCVFRWVSNVNILPHTSHTCAFCPVCDIACFLRLLRSVNLFPHTSHTCGLPPTCLVTCSFSLLLFVKLLRQILQGNTPLTGITAGSTTADVWHRESSSEGRELGFSIPFIVQQCCCADSLMSIMLGENLH
jgi:hypothetical protein